MPEHTLARRKITAVAVDAIHPCLVLLAPSTRHVSQPRLPLPLPQGETVSVGVVLEQLGRLFREKLRGVAQEERWLCASLRRAIIVEQSPPVTVHRRPRKLVGERAVVAKTAVQQSAALGTRAIKERLLPNVEAADEPFCALVRLVRGHIGDASVRPVLALLKP